MKKIFLLICLVLCVCTLSDARQNPYVAGAIYSDAIAPTVTSCSIAADGVTVTLSFSEPVVTTGYDDNDCDLDCTTGGDDVTLDTITGSGSSKAGFTADTTIVSGETCTLDCTVAADEIEDAAGNDYAGDTDKACTNSSTQSAGGPDLWYYTSPGADDDDYDAAYDTLGTYAWCSNITIGAAGDLTKIAVKLHASTVNAFKLAVFNSTTKALMGNCTQASGTVNVWNECTIAQTSVAVTTNQVIIACFEESTGAGLNIYQIAAGATSWYQNIAYADFPPATLVPVSYDDNAYALKVYVD